jgi:hypothetical protein
MDKVDLVTVTYIDVPDTLVNVVGTRSIAKLVGLTTNILVPPGHFEAPHGSREEAGTDEV